MNKYTAVVSGGNLEEEFVLSILKSEETEFIIGVDRGLQFLYDHGIRPDYIVGDFDSVSEEIVDYFTDEQNVPARKFKPEKDASDTEIALQFCLDLRRRHIVIMGATGTRLDHVWANVQALQIALEDEADVRIIDSHNQIRLLSHDFVLKKEEAFGSYFSVFPLGGTVDDLSIRGAKYPLEHHTLSADSSLCVSNEIAEDQVEITFSYGTLVLMETRD